MSSSCKLLLVILYLVYAQNVVIGIPTNPRTDAEDSPGPYIRGAKTSAQFSDVERLKLSLGNAVQEDGKVEPPEKEADEDKEGRKIIETTPPQYDNEIKKGVSSDADDKKEAPNDVDDKKEDTNSEIENNEEAANGHEKEVDPTADSPTNDKAKTHFRHQHFELADDSVGQNWPLGVVPYFLDSTVFDFIVAYNLRKAMDLVESVSCLKFKTLMLIPSQNVTWINITNPNKERECVHETEQGMPGEIVMVLGFDCMKQKQILHTLLHAIGIKDEVTHPLRDQYIHVLWDNIQPKYLRLFRTEPNDVVSRSRFEYDPASIMHFHDRAYSRNGQATIQPLLPGLQIGSSDSLSALDKLKLRTMFGRECNKRNVIGLQESCKNVMSKNNKLPPDSIYSNVEELKGYTNRGIKGSGKGKGKNSKNSAKKEEKEQIEQKMKQLQQDDKLRSSEGN